MVAVIAPLARYRRLRAAYGIAIATVVLAAPPAIAQTSAKPTPGWIGTGGAPQGNWRTRAILEKQKGADGPSGAMSGDETRIILEEYDKSIGKGGAGAKLPDRNEAPSGGSSR